MASLFRFVFAATLLGPLACSSGDGDAADDVTPFTGTLGNQAATESPPAPGANGATPPAALPGSSGGNGSEAPPNPTLVPPAPDPMLPASGGAGGAPAGAGMAGGMNQGGMLNQGGAPAAGGAPANPPAVAPPSGLPLPPGAAGVPAPSGPAENLRVLNWAGFRGAISYTFDDTNGSQIQRYPELNSLDVPFTFYLITAANHTQDIQSPTWPQAVRDGHEIGNHTANHLNAGSAGLAGDTDTGEATLERMFGITVYTMAAPFGANDYVNIARTRYLINRGTPGGTIAPTGTTDPFNLPTFTPNTNAPVVDFNSRVDTLRNTGSWQTVLLHGFTNSVNDGAFQPVAIGVFQQAVTYAKSFGDVWIDTVLAVGAYWRAQAAFSQATVTTNGSSRTFAWTLPANFPPGKFLRVSVDGGTLSQNGAPLVWNDRGFYELALDAGSVTLSP